MGSHEKDLSSPKRALSRSNSTVSSKHSSVQQGSESWEVVEEPRAQGSPGQEQQRHEGYLLKKRKWPLKGWHKRYFVLENGILKYATTRQDVLKGKLHGAIDVRQSVMSVNKKAQRVDLDTEENIYHLKGQWTRILPSGSAPALSTLASSRDKVNAWLKDSEGLERCSAELSECQAKLQELTGMLQNLEALHRIPSAPLISGAQPSAATERPKKGRRTTKIWCTQSFAKDDTIGRVRVGRLHGSVPNLSRYLESSQSQLPFGLPPEYSQLQRSFWVLAQKVHGSLSSVVAALVAERARLEEMRQALDRQCPAPRPGSAGNAAPSLRRFHSLSVSSDTTLDSFASLHPDECGDSTVVAVGQVYVAAFAVSAYASTYYRAGSKPFNPVLGETYECVRPDRGFRFISEQVSHHPPISACHAESDNFIFWQDMRWKNKFWGKSLEIVPVGTVNVQLPRTGDHYEWNKVTTCIHNVLSGPRWIEHYGEVLIRNTCDASYHCKLTFCKVCPPTLPCSALLCPSLPFHLPSLYLSASKSPGPAPSGVALPLHRLTNLNCVIALPLFWPRPSQ
ncbi:oxysterol binding protein like 7 [Willisornis vidua]|uniref:Oxysterol-binding protein n=1 Tax=Willisornis vidua TaxID=1566151 RepID=A0ABQ9DYC1_9PASS|nr:oxysterol binding protein like 7 [Willisornis vidua]